MDCLTRASIQPAGKRSTGWQGTGQGSLCARRVLVVLVCSNPKQMGLLGRHLLGLPV
jgi:hypothetical protein